jgi:hypothetical protein
MGVGKSAIKIMCTIRVRATALLALVRKGFIKYRE